MNSIDPKLVSHLSNPNLIINGCFSVWQRADTTFTNVAKYIVDRFRFVNTENSAVTISTDFADGVKGKELTMSWLDTGEVATKYMEQRVEDVRRVSGDVVFSLNLAHSLGDDVTVYTEQNFGSAGDEPVVYETILTPSSEMSKYVVQLSVPSVEGKTIDDSDSYFKIGIKVSGSVAGVLKTSEWKLEHGENATPFVPDCAAVNLAKCQRYFQARKFGWRGSCDNAATPITSVYFAPMRENITALNSSLSINAMSGLTNARIDLTMGGYTNTTYIAFTATRTAADNYCYGLISVDAEL